MKLQHLLYQILLVGITGLVSLNFSGCAFQRITRNKNITYLPADSTAHAAQQQLNIFSPRKPANLEDVFVFMHGGNWNSGNKSLYSYFGSRLARKGVVAVIIDYPLSPKANYHQMAMAAAKAVQWISKNIEQYGGNPDKIFVAGHSAGGHLATLITVDNAYFEKIGMVNPIKGAILIDAAGLDMYDYLLKENYPEGHTYLRTFTSDRNTWKEASPLYHLRPQMPPMLIYRGEKTYDSIKKSNEKFIKVLKAYVPEPSYHVLKRKKHIPMITQFIWSWNPLYHEIIEFMHTEK